ncbi:MAG: DivIVA domain-containing protein [Vicinamibacteria bacterium]|nr:DivIVA domain-containing protein [Vicinamibacteria bacterium]
MKINPMDVQRQSFSRVLRGFDRDEVRTYLTFVAEELAALQKERDANEQEAQRLSATLAEHREREAILKNTLLTAQRLSDELKENARKQAEQIVREAELRADRLIELAQSRAQDLEHTILDLRAQRQGLRTQVRATIEQIQQILTLEEEAERGDNLHFLKRREGA